MRKSIATVCLSGTLEEKLSAVARAGFDGVEIFENDLLNTPHRPPEIRRLAEDLGLTIDLYQPFRDFEAVPAEVFARNLRRAQLKFDVMRELAAPTMLVCSSVSPDAVDEDALAAEQLHELAERAHDNGVRIAYEALAWGRHVNDFRKSYEIVAAADHPHLGVCLDSFHILSRGTDPAAIREIPGEKIFFLQLADAPYLGMDVLPWSRHHRCFPGQGGFDLPAFLEHVVAAGYQGPLSLEIFNDVFRQADNRPTAVDAMRSLLFLEESLHKRLSASTGSEGAPARERIELFVPPAPSPLHGYAFAEFAVLGGDTPGSGGLGAFEDSLRTLGFARVGRHRSKDVSLWQHGEVRFVLNAERADAPADSLEPVLSEATLSGPVLSAAGLWTDDVVRAANRAESLLARRPPRQRGPGEADLPAVLGQEGITVFFCPHDTDGPTDGPAPWLEDFDADEPPHPSATHLTGIDHMTLSVPFDQFDEAVLYFRSVFGLQPAESMDLADLYGLVRSRALVSPGGSIRLVLNVPPPVASTHAAAPDGRFAVSTQHIALACTDIFATARFLQTQGMAPLPIPENYYDDLFARWELPPDRVAELHRFGILYDREPGGEFMHFYTPLAGRRLWLEFVQRVGTYDGYGAPNAAVRMAAQRRAP